MHFREMNQLNQRKRDDEIKDPDKDLFPGDKQIKPDKIEGVSLSYTEKINKLEEDAKKILINLKKDPEEQKEEVKPEEGSIDFEEKFLKSQESD